MVQSGDERQKERGWLVDMEMEMDDCYDLETFYHVNNTGGTETPQRGALVELVSSWKITDISK